MTGKGNGTVITEYEVIIRNDRSLVPVRLIGEAMGANVDWDGGRREVSIQKGGREIVLSIGKSEATVNGRAAALDCPAIIYKDRTYVPLRFIAENLDATVAYAEKMGYNYKYYYDTQMPLSPAETIVRDFPNIMIDEKYDPGKAAPQAEAFKKVRETCLEGLENFRKTAVEGLLKTGDSKDRYDGAFADIESEISRMLYIGEVSRFYKFTIGPYDILYDKYSGRMFFVIYSDGILIKEVDVNDKSLFMLIFIVG
ncbi:MAG: copper amine oxidase N-terminal domain-containing protein [Clostridiales bacterium]|jgi:hypothetical protein|nr:copper amine oxidase N-terminal domain-containing protein [Clostridiales bacterium]